ncbi:MAG: IS481 family transposase, partial [Flavisolibacter sp.]|nr:IS481 family transposase [Flavisolibacter sp.]
MGKPFTKAIEGVNTERYMALEDMDHTRTKATSLQTNGICERLHRTMCKWSTMQSCFSKENLRCFGDSANRFGCMVVNYNTNGTHSGKYGYGQTPMQSFVESLP